MSLSSTFPVALSSGASTVLRASAYSRMFWLAAQLLPAQEQQRYHIVRTYRYGRRADLARLHGALQHLLDSHCNLRSHFVERDGTLWQSIDERGAVALQQAVARSMDEERALIARFAAMPMDLARDTPCAFLWIDNTATGLGALVVKFHHIALSGADLDATVARIGEFYHAAAPCDDEHNDDVAALAAWIDGEAALCEDYPAGYWAARLRDLPEYNSVAVGERAGRGHDAQAFGQQARLCELPPPLFGRLVTFARAHQASSFDVMKVVWSIVLSHCTGSKRVLVNYPIDVRRKAGRTAKGAMINTLFHVHCNEGSFLDALAAASLRGEDDAVRCLPTALVDKEAGLGANAYHFTIAQSDLGLEGPRLETEGVGCYVPCVGASELLLVCNGPRLVYQHALGAQVRCDFLEQLHGLFCAILCAVIDQPQRDIATIAGLDACVLAVSGPAQGNARRVLERVVRAAHKRPDVLAVVQDDRSLTYGELVCAAAACARQLSTLAHGASRNVGVMLPRGIELVVTMLGTWMAGMTFVPLDRAQPSERLDIIADDAALCVLVTDTNDLALPSWNGPRVRVAETDWLSAPLPLEEVTAGDADYELAYLIYTSGSTGTPKGVAQTHRTLDNLVRWESSQLALLPGAAVAQVAAVGFDVSVQETTYALAHGCTLHVVDEDTRVSPRRLAAFVQDHRVQRMFLPTALLDSLCRAALNDGMVLSSLVNITVAGEALKLTQHVQRFFERHAQVTLFNEYGPTETHVVLANIDGATRHVGGMSLIGQPISNTVAHVLGEQGWPVPAGLVGELYLGGDGVALGYWGREDLSAQRFVANRLAPTSGPGATLYRTGDLVRVLPSGDMQFIGRADQQVKINGHRIELAEIECAMNSHPDVVQTVVLLDGESGRHRLVACFVASRDVDDEALRAYLATRVPAYMMPATLVRMDALPFNANGKVDKARLLAAVPARVQVSTPPASGMEAVLCQWWSRMLGVAVVGVDDDFFALGGDSLGALTMVEELSNMLGQTVTLAQFYQRRSIGALLALAGQGEAASLVVPLRRRDTRTKVFLFHSGRGGVEVYQEFAQMIDADVYGVEAHAVYRDTAIDGVDALCDRYANEVHARVSAGDRVFLGGWSFGGMVAYKVAERLRARVRVEGLVMLDTAPVEVFQQLAPTHDSAWSERLVRYAGARGDDLHARLRRAAEQHDAWYRAASPCIGLPDMPILLFSAEQVDAEFQASAAVIARGPEIWRRRHHRLDIVRVSSTHERMIAECGSTMAEMTNAFCARPASLRGLSQASAGSVLPPMAQRERAA